MGRIVQTNLDSNVPTPVALGVLAAVATAVGVGLLLVYHVTVRDSRAARDWVATPCVIERCELSAESDLDSIILEYRYEYNGRQYPGDRPDLMPGTSGADAQWQQQLYKRYPAGTSAVCYVDPANPASSVFDRDHASETARGLLWLAYPFLCIGGGFSLGVLRWFARRLEPGAQQSSDRIALHVNGKMRRRKKSVKSASQKSRPTLAPAESAVDEAPLPIRPPPRKLGWFNSAVVLAGPRNLQLAWLFVVGFSYLFAILNGPAAFADLLDWRRDEAQAIGKLNYVHPLSQEELDVTVYEYGFTYEVNGKLHTGKSYTRGRAYTEGETVPVTYDRSKPSAAAIKGARNHNLTWWYSAIPQGVLVLLALGLLGMYWHSFRTLRVLRRGEIAKATRRTQVAVGADAAPDFVTAVASLSPYEFFVAGNTYPARHFCPDSGKEEAPEVVVLYDPASPKRNVILDEHLSGLLGSGLGPSLFGRVLDCVNAPLAVTAVILLGLI